MLSQRDMQSEKGCTVYSFIPVKCLYKKYARNHILTPNITATISFVSNSYRRTQMAKLTQAERIDRLEKHLDTLRNGGTVSKRDMLALLDKTDRGLLDELWDDAKRYKQTVIDGRSELDTYNQMLKKADAIWSQYERTVTENKKSETEYAAISAYERALEHLEELLDRDRTIELYLDRSISFEFGAETEPSAATVPRYKLSTSHFAIREDFPSKSEIKAHVIEEAIERMRNAGVKSTTSLSRPSQNANHAALRKLAKRNSV